MKKSIKHWKRASIIVSVFVLVFLLVVIFSINSNYDSDSNEVDLVRGVSGYAVSDLGSDVLIILDMDGVPENPWDSSLIPKVSGEIDDIYLKDEGGYWITDEATTFGGIDSQVYRYDFRDYDSSKIGTIYFTWEGYGEGESGYLTKLYVWGGSSWVELNSVDFTSAVDQSFSTGDLNGYLDANDHVSLLVTSEHYVEPTTYESFNTSGSGSAMSEGYIYYKSSSDYNWIMQSFEPSESFYLTEIELDFYYRSYDSGCIIEMEVVELSANTDELHDGALGDSLCSGAFEPTQEGRITQVLKCSSYPRIYSGDNYGIVYRTTTCDSSKIRPLLTANSYSNPYENGMAYRRPAGTSSYDWYGDNQITSGITDDGYTDVVFAVRGYDGI